MKPAVRKSVVVAFISAVAMLNSAETLFADHRAEINLLGAFPQGEFKDQIDAGFGLSGGYTYGFGGSQSPVSFRLGANGGFIIYGNETRTEPFSTTIPDVTVEVETSNNIVQFGLGGMLAATRGPVRPYMEGRAGFSYFYTETKIRDEDRQDDQDIASSTNFDDTTGYTALGGGLLIPVYSQGQPGAGGFTVSVDLKFLWWWGGKADYLKEGSIERSNGNVVYDVTRSTTDMTTAHLGVAVNF